MRWTEKGESIRQNCEIDLTKLSNGLDENGEPIPDINTDINTDINSNDTKEIECPHPIRDLLNPQ